MSHGKKLALSFAGSFHSLFPRSTKLNLPSRMQLILKNEMALKYCLSAMKNLERCTWSLVRISATPFKLQANGRTLVEIGTPPQYQFLQLDTGSSDTWVNPTCSGAQDPTLCNSYPTWNVGKSTTWQDTQDPIDIVYGSGSVQGEYLTDDFILGADTTISQQQFGYAFQSTILNSGLLGMGIGKLLTGYNTVIDSLAAQGQINSPVFSLDLGSVDSSEGMHYLSA
jgi:hypothetical protein